MMANRSPMTPGMANRSLILMRLLKKHQSLNVGEIAGFGPIDAKQLAAHGIAEALEKKEAEAIFDDQDMRALEAHEQEKERRAQFVVAPQPAPQAVR